MCSPCFTSTDIRLIGGALDTEQAVLVGADRFALRPPVAPHVAFHGPHAHLGAGQRLAGVCVQHKAFGFRGPPAGAQHNGQRADPELTGQHHIVFLDEFFVRAGQQQVETGPQFVRHGERLIRGQVVFRGGQVVGPGQVRLAREQFLTQLGCHGARASSSLAQQLLPVVAHGAEVRLREVAVVHLNGRPRIVPDAFRRDLELLAFDARIRL